MTPDETNQVQTDGLQAEVVDNTAENAEQVAIVVPEVDETRDNVETEAIQEVAEPVRAPELDVTPEVSQETDHNAMTGLDPAEVEPTEPKGEFPLATVRNASGECREYSQEVHGDNYVELAEQYASKIGGKVIYG